jgi:uncharacterized membrane protein
MDVLGQFHPQIVHTPIVLLIFSAFFGLVGRVFDRDWVRKTSVLLLVFGFLGAFLAVRSGGIAHRVPEHQQGVPEHDIDEHGEMGEKVMYLSGAALVAVIAASRLSGNAAQAVGILALVLQLLAAGAVGYTGKLGGELVYEHGANMKLGGVLVKDVGAGAGERGEAGAKVAAPGDSTARAAGAAAAAKPDKDKDDDEKK